MLTLYSYPELFGVADNNGYGLKVFAFLQLAGVPFRHEHIFDASAAPRGQLPYIDDDGETVGDSETIIAHITAKHQLTIDAGLTRAQRDLSHLIDRISTISTGGCRTRAGRTSGSGRSFAMRSCASIRA